MCWTYTVQTPAQWVWGPRCVLDLSYKVSGSVCLIVSYISLQNHLLRLPMISEDITNCHFPCSGEWLTVRSNFGIILYIVPEGRALVIVTIRLYVKHNNNYDTRRAHISAVNLVTGNATSWVILWTYLNSFFSHRAQSLLPPTCVFLFPTLYSLNYW